VAKPHFLTGRMRGPSTGDENRGTDGSVQHGAVEAELDRESCARLGQRRQSPVFLEDSRTCSTNHALMKGSSGVPRQHFSQARQGLWRASSSVGVKREPDRGSGADVDVRPHHGEGGLSGRKDGDRGSVHTAHDDSEG